MYLVMQVTIDMNFSYYLSQTVVVAARADPAGDAVEFPLFETVPDCEAFPSLNFPRYFWRFTALASTVLSSRSACVTKKKETSRQDVVESMVRTK